MSQRVTQDWSKIRPLIPSTTQIISPTMVCMPSSSSVRASTSWLQGLQGLRASMSIRESMSSLATGPSTPVHDDENMCPMNQRTSAPVDETVKVGAFIPQRTPSSQLANSMSSSLTDCSSISAGHIRLTDGLRSSQQEGVHRSDQLRASLRDGIHVNNSIQLWVSNCDLIDPFSYATADGELVVLTTEKDLFYALPVQKKDGTVSYARLLLEHNSPLIMRVGSTNSRMLEDIQRLVEQCKAQTRNSQTQTANNHSSFLLTKFSSKTTYFIDSVNTHSTKRLWIHKHRLSQLSATVSQAYNKLCRILTVVKSKAPNMVLYLKLGTIENLIEERPSGTSQVVLADDNDDSEGEYDNDLFSQGSSDSVDDSKDTNNSKRIPLSDTLFHTSNDEPEKENMYDTTENEISIVTETTTGISYDSSSRTRESSSCSDGTRSYHDNRQSRNNRHKLALHDVSGIDRNNSNRKATITSSRAKDSIEMKCTLMANEPLPDFSIQWMDGTYLCYQLSTGDVVINCPIGQPAWQSVPFVTSGAEEDIVARSSVFNDDKYHYNVGSNEWSENADNDIRLDITDGDRSILSHTTAPHTIVTSSCIQNSYNEIVATSARYSGKLGMLSIHNDGSMVSSMRDTNRNDNDSNIPLRFKGYLKLAQIAIHKVFELRREEGVHNQSKVKTVRVL
jgi:hypothetical protein